MSKSRGNVIDPLTVMEQFGTDALRFTLSIMAVPGTDISLSEKRLEGYRAFCNKIWNATRFVLMNIDEDQETGNIDYNQLSLSDRWILSRLSRLIESVDKHIEEFRFHEAANQLYHFLWGEFCDWYIEASKPRLMDGDEQVKGLLVQILTRILKLLHPFMPYITEEIYQKLPNHGESITIESFPVARQDWLDEEAEAEFSLLMELVSRIRNIRAEKNIPPSRKVEVEILALSDEAKTLITEQETLVSFLAGTSRLELVSAFDENAMYSKAAATGMEIGVSLENLMNKEEERARIQRELDKLKNEIDKLTRKLNNEDFLSRAPRGVVEKNRAKFKELKKKQEIMQEELKKQAN